MSTWILMVILGARGWAQDTGGCGDSGSCSGVDWGTLDGEPLVDSVPVLRQPEATAAPTQAQAVRPHDAAPGGCGGGGLFALGLVLVPALRRRR